MTQTARIRLENERDRVFGALESAARMVGQRDAYILENDLREEVIIHRLARYLEDILLSDTVLDLQNFSVDCIYNGGTGYKREQLQIEWPTGSQAQLRKRDQHARPDITVHQRGSDWLCFNLLMVEVRKSSTISHNAQRFAFSKCRAYRETGLNYMFAGYVCFKTGHSLQNHAEPWTEIRKFPNK